MADFEKLGAFYLGRTNEGLYLYDSKDLVTHAVCVGMTGSGKTGLCISLLEEAAIDGIPALVIDPKGDLSNLLLNFPNLAPDDFAPWLHADDARKKGLDMPAYASQTAQMWKDGLAKWGQDGARVERLRNAADFAIYTPGSSAGVPVSVLKSFAAPDEATLDDREALRERINSTVTALLGLVGIEADPIQSREHIFLSNLLSEAWAKQQDMDIASLITQIQSPPVTRIGVMELEAFYPAKERFSLAMALNNLLASPGFEAWIEGEALDIDRMLYTEGGKPRISIFSISHLSDSERMFFVSLLLNQTLSWMRRQPGTTSLRAILYMDEIFGYFPPVANPPSKLPLLTLLKQARAFGLGCVLATQNPVDLDYKGLANAGTWFIGKLQTERDKARVLDGLEGAASQSGGSLNRQALEQLLASLGNRVFLVNNVHEGKPELFETRWALSYLAGPLTRPQIKTLMAAKKVVSATASAAAAPATAKVVVSPVDTSSTRPVLPPEISQYFLPVSGTGSITYQPVLLAAATMRFTDAKLKLDVTKEALFSTAIVDEALPVHWDNAEELEVALSNLETSPAEGANFAPLHAQAQKAKSYAAWNKEFLNWLTATQQIEVFQSPSTKTISNAGESERDFRIRLSLEMRESRDAAVEKLRAKYAPKIAVLEERLRKAQQAVERESQQASEAKLQTVLSVGAGLLNAFLGKKTLSQKTISSVSSAARSYGRASKEGGDVERAQETVEAVQAQLNELNAEIEEQVQALQAASDPQNEELVSVVVKPKKTNVTVRLFSLAWAPVEGA